MKIHLTWRDPIDQHLIEKSATLPVAMGRSQEMFPPQFEGNPVAPVILRADDGGVSRFHNLIYESNGHVMLQDRSKGGTAVNGQQLHNASQAIHSGDVLVVGTHVITYQLAALPATEVGLQTDQRSSQLQSALPKKRTSAAASVKGESKRVERLTQLGALTQQQESLSLKNRNSFGIGRDETNELVLAYPAISRFHLRIQRQQGEWIVEDLKSTNGTFVNGQSVGEGYRLKADDVIQFGPCSLIFQADETLVYYSDEGNLRLDAIKLNKTVGAGIQLLNDISLSIFPREFITVAGVSGGGKSTLLDALNGLRPATNGSVLVNGQELYANFDAYRTEIGYVPQKDIVHRTLTVWQTLRYASELRLPSDSSSAEIRQRVGEVLNDLELSARRDVLVDQLSGGQLKRVSMGVELLTKPNLFFLDEATSGLDPGTEREVMQLLRKLADQGRTILLITHATDNVTLCDLVVFLAAGGRVAYFGPPSEAPSYFGVDSFNEIYRKVEKEKSPELWQSEYRQSAYFQRYVLGRQDQLGQIAPSGNQKNQTDLKLKEKARRVSLWQQFKILTYRNLNILKQDKTSLFLMLAIAPILGIMDFFIWSRNIFDVEDGDPQQTLMMLFVAVIIAIMVGSLSSMREIIKEKDIFQRERMVFLKITPYVFSKFFTGVLISVYQAAVFVLFKFLTIHIGLSNAGFDPVLIGKVYLTLLLATVGGMVMGLLVSALAPNQNVAPLLIILTLIPQITLGGGLLPVQALPTVGHAVSHLTFSRWAFEAMVSITEVGHDLTTDPCFKYSEAKREGLNETQKIDQCQCLGPELFQNCRFPGIKAKDKPIVRSPEPTKPSKPDKPDSLNPQNLNTFSQAIDAYETDISQWQTDYSRWKEEREGAIGGAEETLIEYHKDYGSIFDVSFVSRWLISLGLSTSFLGSILVILRRKTFT